MTVYHPAMHEYQRKALDFALEHKESYQSLGLGLGKTLIAIQWIVNVKPKATLVVAPIKVMWNTWPDELQKWAPHLKYVVLHGPDKARLLQSKADVYLINYEGLVWLYTTLWKNKKRIPFNAVILDEGTKIKSHSTKRFKALKAMRPLFTAGKIVLSGTPAPNTLLNLWSQYFFLDGGERLDKHYTKFQVKYFEPLGTDGRVWVIKTGVAPLIYEKIRDITFRLEGTDYVKMPKRIDNFIKLTLPPEVRRQYDELESEYFLALDQEKSIEVFNSAAISMKLRQFVQGAVYTGIDREYHVFHQEKIEALKELVEQNEGTPILCAIQFIFELELIHKVFPGTPCIRGGVSNTDARALVQAWNRKELPLLLCHPNSLSHGMNMQSGGNIIVWHGLPWSGEVYEQFIGRLERQGQLAETIVVNHFIMKGTIDVAIAASLKSKAKGQKDLLDYIRKYHAGELEEL